MKTVSIYILFSFFIIRCGHTQPSIIKPDYSLLENRYLHSYQGKTDTLENSERREFPNPKSVMFKSMMVPGWGQIENRQAWKVPVIYALFAGVGVYTHHLNGQYKDYRAAYYNTVHGADSDMKFGPTPERLEGLPSSQLESNRNSLRNQRDFMFVVFGLAYGLNVLDAYVYAHMRSFDVSDDLSARTVVQPVIMADRAPAPGIKFSFTISKK